MTSPALGEDFRDISMGDFAKTYAGKYDEIANLGFSVKQIMDEKKIVELGQDLMNQAGIKCYPYCEQCGEKICCGYRWDY